MKIFRTMMIILGVIVSLVTTTLIMWLIFFNHNIVDEAAVWLNVPADLLKILLIGSLFGLLLTIQISYYQSRQ